MCFVGDDVVRRAFVVGIVMVFVGSVGALADDVIYRYEGDVLPHDPSAGWIIADTCEPPCSESVADGSFNRFWDTGGDFANHHYWISLAPDSPPPSLWVEWRYRSTTVKPPNFYTCDGAFTVSYKEVFFLVFLFGDAAITFDGGTSVAGLDIDEFHLYRFETMDGKNYRVSVDGSVFVEQLDFEPNENSYIQFHGEGGCGQQPTTNEWSFIRYGTVSFGEQIVSTDPPQGNLNQNIYDNLDRFTVTFDAANYVYLDEITVTTTGGVDPPVVLQTRRGDDFEPDTVEIVLDRPLAPDQETRFTFNDGTTTNEVVYTLFEPPPIPTTSSWGMVALVLLVLVSGTIALRARAPILRLLF